MSSQFCSQEPKEISEDKDIFNVNDLAKKIRDILIANEIKKTKEAQIIGIFDGFGEGKSTFLKTFKKYIEDKNDKANEKQFCIIEFDLWKYNSQELKNQFDRVFAEERAPYFITDNLNHTFKDITSYFTIVSELAKTGKTLNSRDRRLIKSNFRYGTKKSIKKLSKKSCKSLQEQEVIIVLENLDRLTIEDKILALSSLYNHRDYLESNVIVLIDPNSIQEGGNHFENLIHKCFTSTFFIEAKSKEKLLEYIECKISPYNYFNDKELIQKYIISQYPLSLRVINHIINNLLIQVNNFNDFNETMILKSILQIKHPRLYKELSLNPYKLINSNFKEKLNSKQLLLFGLYDKSYSNIERNLNILSPNLKSEVEKFKLLIESKNFDIVTKILIDEKNIEKINLAFSDYDYFIYVLKSSKFQDILNIISNNNSFIFPVFDSLDEIKDTLQIGNYSDLFELIYNENFDEASIKVKKSIFKNPKLYKHFLKKKIRLQIDINEYIDIISKLDIKDRVYYYSYFADIEETDIYLKLYDIIENDLIILNDKDIEEFDHLENIIYFYLYALLNYTQIDKNKYLNILLKSKLFKILTNQNKLDFFLKLIQNEDINFEELININILEYIIDSFNKAETVLEKKLMLDIIDTIIDIDELFDDEIYNKKYILLYYLNKLSNDEIFKNMYIEKIEELEEYLNSNE